MTVKYAFSDPPSHPTMSCYANTARSAYNTSLPALTLVVYHTGGANHLTIAERPRASQAALPVPLAAALDLGD